MTTATGFFYAAGSSCCLLKFSRVKLKGIQLPTEGPVSTNQGSEALADVCMGWGWIS